MTDTQAATASDPFRTVTNSQRRALKGPCCVAWVVFGSCLMHSVIATAARDGTFVTPSDTRRFQRVLEREFPGYALFDWPNEMRGYRQSPEHFVGDLLVGDFNFDGVIDFAAMLSRSLSDDELIDIPEHYQAPTNRVGLTVVCNGVNDGSSVADYSCTTLTDEELGGNSLWLDLVDITIWMDDLENETEEYNNPDCPSRLRSPSEEKLLSLVQPVGHCDSYFYSLDSGGYGRCMYCAD